MHFICQQHQQQLHQKSFQDLSGQWFDWMSQASVYYELGLNREVLAYAGSAIDLSLILIGKADLEQQAAAAKKLVLACIYLTNSLVKAGEFDKAKLYQSIYYDVLQKYCYKLDKQELIDDIEYCWYIVDDKEYC